METWSERRASRKGVSLGLGFLNWGGGLLILASLFLEPRTFEEPGLPLHMALLGVLAALIAAGRGRGKMPADLGWGLGLAGAGVLLTALFSLPRMGWVVAAGWVLVLGLGGLRLFRPAGSLAPEEEGPIDPKRTAGPERPIHPERTMEP